MRSLIIIDFSHLCARCLFVSTNNCKVNKETNKINKEDYKNQLVYLIFNSLRLLRKKFNGEFILALDSRNYWRKDFYAEYKAQRAKAKEDSKIDFKDYYEIINEVIDIIDINFPFKCIKSDKAEADDIAGVICKYTSKNKDFNKITLVTSDHDWKQNLVLNNIAKNEKIEFYDPMKKNILSLNDFESKFIDTDLGKICRFSLIHSLKGDAGDNIPSVVKEYEFSDNFKLFLKNKFNLNLQYYNDIDILELNNIINSYDIFKPVKLGKLKGTLSNIKDVYKTIPFGEKRINSIIESSKTLNNFLKTNKKIEDDFLRNNTLVNFKFIPDYIKKSIIHELEVAKDDFNKENIKDYFYSLDLIELYNKVDDFIEYSTPNSNIITLGISNIDDLF